MKKFENLGRMLSKEEQKHILGGDAPGDDGRGVEAAWCTNMENPGCWYYTPLKATYAKCQADIQTYCSSGTGNCGSVCPS